MPSARAFARADGSGLWTWGLGLELAIPSPESRTPSPSVTNGAAAARASRSANSRREMGSGIGKFLARGTEGVWHRVSHPKGWARPGTTLKRSVLQHSASPSPRFSVGTPGTTHREEPRQLTTGHTRNLA